MFHKILYCVCWLFVRAVCYGFIGVVTFIVCTIGEGIYATWPKALEVFTGTIGVTFVTLVFGILFFLALCYVETRRAEKSE